MCLYPRLIKNKKYESNNKNGGEIPKIQDERVLYVPIGCGNCIECRKQKAREWQVRLQEEIKTTKNGIFITLTFSDQSIKELIEQEPTKYWPSLKGLEGYNLDNEIATRAVRLFLERWRKKHKKSVKHWLVTELGQKGTENIHLHGIIWTTEKLETIEKTWKYGYIWPNKNTTIKNYVNEKTVNYIIKYISKVDTLHTQYKSKILTSKGIGNNYTKTYNANKNKYNNNKTIETYKTKTGHEITLPVYWRNKIYTEEEREKLWLQKLDKQIRWIRGEKISIKNGEQNYFKLLKWHQKQNIELGYADGKKDWKKHEYESEIRNIKKKERMAKAKWKTKTKG